MAPKDGHVASKRAPILTVSTGDMKIRGASPKEPDKGEVKSTQMFKQFHLPAEIDAAKSEDKGE